MEQLPQVSEDPRRVVLKLEVVLCRGDKLISGAVVADLSVPVPQRTQLKHIRVSENRRSGKTYISNVVLDLASKSASVNGRSSLALVRDTATRIPVSML